MTGLDPRLYRFYRPCPALAPYVACLWTRRMDSADGSPPVHTALPNPWTDAVLVMTRAADPGPGETERVLFERLAVSGPNTAPRTVPMRRGDLVLGVRFRLGGALPVLGEPAHEFTDRPARLGDVWGGTLEERLRSAPSVPLAVAALQEALCGRLRRWRGEDGAGMRGLLERLARLEGGFTAAQAAALAGVTPRQLQRRFLRWVGVGPKLFARMLRFERAVSLLRDRASPDWHGAACEAGYSDRPHMARELRAFAGLTPAELLAA